MHMVVRAREQGDAMRREIARELPGGELVLGECDISLLGSVRAFAERFDGPLHVLCTTVMPDERQVTDEGNRPRSPPTSWAAPADRAAAPRSDRGRAELRDLGLLRRHVRPAAARR